jgi:hypothetical protein
MDLASRVGAPLEAARMNAREMREVFRDELQASGSRPAYTRARYRRLIAAHVDTLRKYLRAWPKFYAARWGRPWRGAVTVARILPLLQKQPAAMAREFVNYLLWKTHLSYEVDTRPSPMKLPAWARRLSPAAYRLRVGNAIHDPVWEKNKAREKGAEFLMLILAEYVILHNYMWASGLRPAGVRSVDRWLEDARPGAAGFKGVQTCGKS